MSIPSERREERIALLRRQEETRRRLPDFLCSLNKFSRHQVTESDVLSVEETDHIWSQIYKNHELQQAQLSISFPYRDKKKLTAVFNSLDETFKGQKQYFTTAKFHGNCFLFIDTSFCIDKYEELIELDGDTFFVYDKELNNGLWVDTSEEHWRAKEDYTWTYELRVCGVDWIDKIYSGYKNVVRKT